MTNEEFITEASIIPQNFSWRAGIGKDMPSQSTTQVYDFSPFSASFTPNKGWDTPQVMSPEDVIKHGQKLKASAEFDKTVIPEIELHITEIVSQFKNKANTHENWLAIKRKIREYCFSLTKKYKDNITAKTLERLYNACLNDYTSDWLFICGNNNVNNISGTEYVYTKDNEFLINPFVIYSVFAGCLSPQGNVQLNEQIICE